MASSMMSKSKMRAIIKRRQLKKRFDRKHPRAKQVK